MNQRISESKYTIKSSLKPEGHHASTTPQINKILFSGMSEKDLEVYGEDLSIDFYRNLK